MLSLTNLKSAVARKSGQSPISCDAEGLLSRLGYDVGSMRQHGFDPFIIEEHQAFNDKLETILSHADLFYYLSSLTPANVYMASGIKVLTLEAIKNEIRELSPGSILFRFGYFPIASSIGGNSICFHAPTNQFVWADHESFGGAEISLENRITKKCQYIPLTPDAIEKAVVSLAIGFGNFLDDLLEDKFEKQFEELD